MTTKTGPVVDKTAIRNAATILLLRDRATAPKVLMGQRGAKAAFMPNKYVFPGGAVDAGDAQIPLARSLPDLCQARLNEESDLSAETLAVAAIRELWEETGQILGQPTDETTHWSDAPQDWAGFAAAGYRPDAAPLQFVFRAVTPTGRPRRFDARFFLADADDLATDPDDFEGAEDELSHLHWVLLSEARALDLPFITQVVLAEIAARAHDHTPPKSVPFFRNDDEAHLISRLDGISPLAK
ncbi:NUDIX domain-containing protein [Aestuariibius sp. HNIBRBA575]|uniref:NUDIX hydrolase n=1 Tax=Aestuariibius sp. HNIBRBA575 TaxID=3233343 RepID=UPI0034A4E180